MFPISKKNLSKATTYTMLLSATVHLFISLLIAMTTNNPDVVNMFNILGISLLFPELGQGALNCLIGILAVIGFGVGVYYLMQYQDRFQAKNQG